MIISRSSQLYLERFGFRRTFRGPASRTSPENLPVNTWRLQPPLPRPELLLSEIAPSQHDTVDPWPHGAKDEL